MTAAITLDRDAGLLRIERWLGVLATAKTMDLMDEIGALVENQTKMRFEAGDKKRPDGSSWSNPPWSKKYRKWRGRKRKLKGGYLVLYGHLQQSIEHQLRGGSVMIGSNLDYARRQQYGGGGVPARQYLGLSKANEDEVEQELGDWLRKMLP